MIILLCSPTTRAGKDEVAKYIAMNFKFKIDAFANDVKQIAFLLNWNGRKDEKGRELLINIGELAKKYDPTIWVDRVTARVSNSTNKNYVISDYRYVIENKLIDKLNKTTPIVSIGIEMDSRNEELDFVKENQSEYDKLKKNYIIKNNGNLDSLYKQVDEIMRKILIGNI
jgi:hypothetical protein